MTPSEKEQLIQEFVEKINDHDLSVIEERLDRNFFNHIPAEGEITAPQILKELLGDIIHAFPDLKIGVDDFVEENGNLNFSMTMSGTHSEELWGAPGSGKRAVWASDITSRFTNGKFAFEWHELPMPSLLAALRQIDLVPPPEDMDKPTKYPVSLPEFLIKLIFTGQAADKPCSHLDQIQVIEPGTKVCHDCEAMGDLWPALRMCLICGYVGCCDTSKNTHMKGHYENTGHPLFRSIRLQESWVWCYEDNAFFSGEILEKYR
jgi:predicted ester cyclase